MATVKVKLRASTISDRSESIISFFIFMENVISRLMQLKRIGTVKNYRAALSSFKRFRDNDDISMEAIDHITMEDYQEYLKSSGLAPNSISFYMRTLCAVYNRAVDQNITYKPQTFPYGIHRSGKDT